MMALIHCSNCGQPVSDKATACPHCGFAFPEKTSATSAPKICIDCGTQYDGSLSACPQCGCPSTNKSKKHTGLTVTLIVFAALILVGGFLFFANQKAKAAMYNKNMESVSYLMLNGAADAENAGNLIKSVWFNAIYQEKAAATDPFTIVDGKFVDDFNDALSNLFSDAAFMESIAKIQSTQNDVTALMKQLRKPPKDYEEAYDVLKVYYEDYMKMTQLVINPVGSLQSFSDDFNELDEEVVNAFEKMKLYLA